MNSIAGIVAALDKSPISLSNSKTSITGGKSFQQTLQEVKTPQLNQQLQTKNSDSYEKLVQFREAILSGKKFTPEQLISYQILASELGIKVEMISKVAEGAMSAARKLQSNQ